MALDGALLSQIVKEIQQEGMDTRIDRIHQPSGDELIIQLRKRGGANKLLISAGANNPRIHFTENPPENPATPPMFCMLLRKHLQGSLLTVVQQLELDRVLFLHFRGYTALGDPTTFILAVEIMGRHSNIVLLDESKRIMDAIHRVDFETSSVRQLLPGMMYTPPPGQEKHNILTQPYEAICETLETYKEFPLSKALLETLQGFSPLPARELSFEVTQGRDKNVEDLSLEEKDKLNLLLKNVHHLLENGESIPTMLVEESGKPKDFCFFPIKQYGQLYSAVTYKSYGELLDYFYTKRSTMDRIRQKSSTLLRQVKNSLKRTTRRVAAQESELLESQNRQELKIKGDLLTANIYQLTTGASSATVANYYDPQGGNMTIELDPRKSPAENAQHYYKDYRKADTAEKKLTQLLKTGKNEMEYLESVLDILQRGETEGDLESVREELVVTGYIRKSPKKKSLKPLKQGPFEYISQDGFTIYAGRNNLQNDALTLRQSKKEDLWFHTQNIPGSHVVVVSQGKTVPESTLYEAAVIAAYHSQGSNGSKIPVDYAEIKNVKKASGGKPGMVHYENFKTILANPTLKAIEGLQV